MYIIDLRAVQVRRSLLEEVEPYLTAHPYIEGTSHPSLPALPYGYVGYVW